MTTPDGRVILLVEDNPDDEFLTRHALAERRVANSIVTVTDGKQALDYVFGARDDVRVMPDLILLDLKLPKVDGLEVLDALRRDGRTRHLPVVVLTSSREERDIVESYRLGANSYVRKPVDFDEFAAAVREVGLYWLVLNQPSGARP